MSLDLSHFQNPKMAIIRLLKSQCLCLNGEPCNQKKHQPLRKEEQNIALLKYKEELQRKVSFQKAKLNEIPCVITLAEQIEQVKQIIAGLTRQNRQRIGHVKRLQREVETEKVHYFNNSYQEQAQLIEHQKLQAEYASLLRNLQVTNDENQRLIRRLANQ